MATPNPSINPYLGSNAPGLFSITETGLVQGVFLDDPAMRFQLASGSLATDETLPMTGGYGIYENIPIATEDASLGGRVGRATNITAGAAKSLTGFSVFNQAYNGVTSPQSPVPLFGTSNTINFLRLGSLMRVVLAIDPALVNLDGTLISSAVSWDYTAQRVVKYTAAYSANTITGAVWASTSGGQTTFTVSSDPTTYAVAGATIDVSGVVSTGATTDGYNGTFIVVSSTSTTIVVTQARAASPGTYASGGTVAAGGGALPVKILRVQTTGVKTVSYNTTTGFATWATSSNAAAICLI